MAYHVVSSTKNIGGCITKAKTQNFRLYLEDPFGLSPWSKLGMMSCIAVRPSAL